MARTEAGKRLLDEWADDHERVQLEPMVDAIEAEARAAERARIRAAVPRCDCPEHGHYEGCCRAAAIAKAYREDTDGTD